VLVEGLEGTDLLDHAFLQRGLGSHLAADVAAALTASGIAAGSGRSGGDSDSAASRVAGARLPLIHLHLTPSSGRGRLPASSSGSSGGTSFRIGSADASSSAVHTSSLSARVVLWPSAPEVIDTVMGVVDRIPSVCEGYPSAAAAGTRLSHLWLVVEKWQGTSGACCSACGGV
jgi:hypothetical protein